MGAARRAAGDGGGSVSDALIRLDAAGVNFGAVLALRDIALTLHRGDRLALVGANGSGKTTLLRLLNGLLAPHSGQRVVTGAPRSAMLFQRPFLLRLSVQRNLSVALWLAGVPAHERAQRGAAALDRVGLAALADRPARSLSAGQQQRLALARAWALKPDILYLDEPTASLDPSAKREVEALIDEFGRDGMTLCFASHNLGQVKRLARRVVHLDAGQLRADLPAAQFFDRQAALPAATVQFLNAELPWT